MVDVAIIGAGINGTSTAFELTQRKKSVMLLDMQGIASGGSGAAGAFISPKFSKEGVLKELINDAFVYSFAFYEKHFSHLFMKTELLHVAKYEDEEEILNYYKKHTPLELLDSLKDKIPNLTQEARSKESISIHSAIVNAKAMCEALAAGTTFKQEKVTTLYYDDGIWIINDTYSAKHVVLATGAYESILHEPYLSIRGVWGHRIDIKTSSENLYSIHQYVSISPKKEGVVAIGATHNVHYHPQKNKEPYDIESGRKELLEKATRTILLEDIEVIKDYTGLRSASADYIPLVGPLVMSQESLAHSPRDARSKKTPYEKFIYYPNLTMINGNGGYGFVLAPYLAKMLVESMYDNSPIKKSLHPARAFSRWVRRS